MKTEQEIRDRIEYLEARIGPDVPDVVRATVDCMVGELHWILGGEGQ